MAKHRKSDAEAFINAMNKSVGCYAGHCDDWADEYADYCWLTDVIYS